MAETDPSVQAGYAPVNDLDMYYEIHGEGRPLILLDGAFMTIDTIGGILPGLAATRQVSRRRCSLALEEDQPVAVRVEEHELSAPAKLDRLAPSAPPSPGP